MLTIIKNRLDNRINLGKLAPIRQDQEKREYWDGRCPICKTFNEVETEDIRFDSGFFGTPTGHYTRCLDCGYNDVPVKCKNI